MIKSRNLLMLVALLSTLSMTSCKDSESYADLLNKAKTSEKIYFRYMRYNLYYWYTYNEMIGSGNENDMNAAPTYFQYNNYTLTVSSQWGYGIQLPLTFLGVDSEVNLIIKSQYGWASEISNVQPYLYHVRYFRNQI